MPLVGLLGTVHTSELREKFNFPLALLEEIILDFQPDILCGEVRADDWQKYSQRKEYKGYLGPSEYRKLFLYVKETTLRFVQLIGLMIH